MSQPKDKITPAELQSIFGNEMPMWAVNMIFNADPSMTCGNLRRAIIERLETDKARLCHFAPELAAAIRKLTNILDFYEHKDDGQSIPILVGDLREAKAILDKAEGQP